MKCKYCNADIEQDAQFCPNCGKDLSKFNKCIKCGELLDSDTVFCPHCGAEQDNKDVAERTGSKKWMWAIIAVILLAIIGGGAYFATNGGLGSKALAEAVDSDSIAVVDSSDAFVGDTDIHSVEGIKARLTEILAKGMSMPEKDAIKKYFSKEFQDIYFKVENYDTKNIPEGEIGFWDFSLWGDGQGELNSFHFDVLEIQNVKASSALAIVDYISDEIKNAKMTTNINLVFENGNWLIDEITDENALSYKKAMQEYLNNTSSDISQSQGIITISQLRNGKSFEDVLSSLNYKYKKVENDRGYVTVYWYQNCELNNNLEVDKPINKNACVVEVFDGMSASIRITVFDAQVFEDIKNQTLQYCKKDKNGIYQFDWGNNEELHGRVEMGFNDFREGGYYIDIPI